MSRSPALMKQKLKEPVMSQRAPASAGPSIDDMSRKQLIKPNIVDRVSIPNRSTNLMEDNDTYDVLYCVTTYSLMHTNEKNTFKVTLLLNTFNSFKLKQNNILYQITIKLLYFKI